MFEDKAISLGIQKFVKEYDFYSLYPTKKGVKEDIYNVIRKILRIQKLTFVVTDLVNNFKVSQTAAISYIKIMKNYGLVEEIENIDNIRQHKYKIIDPKIIYLINQSISTI